MIFNLTHYVQGKYPTHQIVYYNGDGESVMLSAICSTSDEVLDDALTEYESVWQGEFTHCDILKLFYKEGILSDVRSILSINLKRIKRTKNGKKKNASKLRTRNFVCDEQRKEE